MLTAYLVFHAQINPVTAQHLMAACASLIQRNDELYLCLSTPGGQVASGITIYNFLRGLPTKITTHNIGNIDSIGNAIFLSGDTRRASKHSTFMFHGVGFEINAKTTLGEKNLREFMDGMSADHKRIADIIADRTTLPLNKARKLFAEARTKDADDALNAGIIHEVSDLTIPPGAPVTTLVLT
jgi:ATP-dependent protease ClpP protease subunit